MGAESFFKKLFSAIFLNFYNGGVLTGRFKNINEENSVDYKFSTESYSKWIGFEDLLFAKGYRVEGYSFLNNYYLGYYIQLKPGDGSDTYIFQSLVSPFFIYFQKSETNIHYPKTDIELETSLDVKKALLSIFSSITELPLEYLNVLISKYVNEDLIIEQNEMNVYDVLFGGMQMKPFDYERTSDYGTKVQIEFANWANSIITE